MAKKELNMETAQEIVEEYKDQEKFSMKDTIKLMKKSGLSYKQLMQGMKMIAEETEKVAAEVEARGEVFDRKEFFRQKMEVVAKQGKKK